MSANITSKPRALVAHPYWGRGGAECAAMWVIEALLPDYDVTVYTRGGFDLDGLNRLADLAIETSQLRIRVAHGANAWPLGALAYGAYLRSLKTVGAEYDLRVTASGVAHWGRPAIQFISSATWNDTLAAKFDAPTAPHRRNFGRAVMHRLAASMSAERVRSLNEDLFVANSYWTARQSAPFCPGELRVIYPAVPLPSPAPEWDKRENGVLVFGRVSPEKRIETCIEIVERLRKTGRSLQLCIAGPNGDAGYSAGIDSLCAKHRDWIERVPLVVGDEKRRLLGRFRYGLSACEIEAFGIATAEMSCAGVVTLAPRASAQQEILLDTRQLYSSVDEAIERFAQLLDSEGLQRLLHKQAVATRQRFLPERFINEVRDLASGFGTRSRSTTATPPGELA